LTDDAAVNVPLLAAYLQLCRAIDLKSPATILQIISHTLKKNGIAEADGFSEAWQQQVLKSFVKN
ncbi:MAG: hypothetical protein WAJ95_05365, partial [Desulfobacterales bacterium]